MAVLDWIQASWLADALRRNGDAYMLVNASHLLGLGLLIGAITPLDLRLLGLGARARFQVLAPFLSRCAALRLGVALLTGAALWAARPEDYLGNSAFLWKMALPAVAGLQHIGPGWRRVVPDRTVGMNVRFLASISLVCWLAVLLAGRWIGLVWRDIRGRVRPFFLAVQ